MEKLAEHIMCAVKKHVSDSCRIQERVLTMDKDSFQIISKKESPSYMTFIDGGNTTILSSPSLTLSFIRVYHTTYLGTSRQSAGVRECFLLVTLDENNNYITEVFFEKEPWKVPKMTISLNDPDLKTGKDLVSIDAISGLFRRIAEIDEGKRACKKGSVVIDGTLESKHPLENLAIQSLFVASDIYSNTVCGIAKTSTLTTEKGDTTTAVLSRIAPKGAWIFNGDSLTHFVRLHERADRCFRMDVNPGNDAKMIASYLMPHSVDPIFLGYPYGLIEADRFGRVSNKEREQMQIRLRMILGKSFKSLEPYLHAKDAHIILDTIG